jgi:transposase-like protein
VAKKRGPYKKYPKEFRQMAVARMAESENLTALAKELGVPLMNLYAWRAQLGGAEAAPRSKRYESMLRQENSELKRLLADKILEADFFRGALQKIEARRQQQNDSGVETSTTKSEK